MVWQQFILCSGNRMSFLLLFLFKRLSIISVEKCLTYLQYFVYVILMFSYFKDFMSSVHSFHFNFSPKTHLSFALLLASLMTLSHKYLLHTYIYIYIYSPVYLSKDYNVFFKPFNNSIFYKNFVYLWGHIHFSLCYSYKQFLVEILNCNDKGSWP
jgi:hypothetical protein